MKQIDRRYRGLRVMAVFLCMVLLCSVQALPATAVTQADIDALKGDAADLDVKKKDLESKLKGLAGDKRKALQEKTLLDEQIANTNARISNMEAQIEGYAILITEAEERLLQAETEEAAQYELFCKRVREMEENGTVNYWSILFRANSFSDLLGRLDIVNEIMNADQRIIDNLKALQEEIKQEHANLETRKAESEAARDELTTQKVELGEQRTKADRLVQQIRANENEYEDALNELEEEEEAIQKKIVALSEQLAREQAQGSVALGGYIWPVSSRRITSPMGSRYTGIPGASTNHKGVDIGGVGYTSSVYAAKAGTVIVSQYSKSYGNYVVVSHGAGNTTLYAHMSSRKVSVNTYVKQGDVLGITGSTGISSGPHLHFEITEKGNRINPLNYLTGYVKAW